MLDDTKPLYTFDVFGPAAQHHGAKPLTLPERTIETDDHARFTVNHNSIEGSEQELLELRLIQVAKHGQSKSKISSPLPKLLSSYSG